MLDRSQKPAGPSSHIKPLVEAKQEQPKSVKIDNEHDKLFRVIEAAFKTQILDNPAQKQAYESYQAQLSADSPDKRTVTLNFEKMRAHFNCLAEIEAQQGDLTNNALLREVLKKNSFLLGLEACKNKNNQIELANIKRSTQRLRDEKTQLETAQETKESELQTAKAKLYDIDFDFY